jgi:hypothetical protein
MARGSKDGGGELGEREAPRTLGVVRQPPPDPVAHPCVKLADELRLGVRQVAVLVWIPAEIEEPEVRGAVLGKHRPGV